MSSSQDMKVIEYSSSEISRLFGQIIDAIGTNPAKVKPLEKIITTSTFGDVKITVFSRPIPVCHYSKLQLEVPGSLIKVSPARGPNQGGIVLEGRSLNVERVFDEVIAACKKSEALSV